MAEPFDAPADEGDAAARPRLIAGGLAVDERGQLSFVNDFDFAGVRRFYVVANRRAGQVRAWQAHRHEAKFFFCLRGAVRVGAVAVDDWQRPSRAAAVERHELTADRPALLYIPPGWANGWMAHDDDAQLLVYSTSTLDQSKADDVRFDFDHWHIWER